MSTEPSAEALYLMQCHALDYYLYAASEAKGAEKQMIEARYEKSKRELREYIAGLERDNERLRNLQVIGIKER